MAEEEKKNNVVDLALARFNRGLSVRTDPAPPKKSITVADVLAIFPGEKIVEIPRGNCLHCSKDYIPEWRRGGKIIEAVWPDGRVTLQCHYCGRKKETN